VNRGHFARAVLESTAFQTLEVVEAMEKDSKVKLSTLKVDGGMVHNELLMQFQADLLDVRWSACGRRNNCLRCSLRCRSAVGFWKDFTELQKNWARIGSGNQKWIKLCVREHIQTGKEQ